MMFADGVLSPPREDMPRDKRPNVFSQHIAPLALLVAIALLGLGFIITRPEGLLNVHSDLAAEHLATQTVFHDLWQAEHRVPLWRSDILSGAPALSNPQSLYTHPLHWLFAFYRPDRAVGLVVWLQMLLAGIGGYYIGVVLRLSAPARLLVGVATLFSFKTVLAAYAGWLPVLTGIAAMPFLFAASALVLERPSLSSILSLGGAGALSLHAGHPQLIYYAVLFIVLWSLMRIVHLLKDRDVRKAIRVSASLALATLIACGLSAYLLLPIARDAALVTRGAASYEFFLGTTPYPIVALLTLIKPELFGTPLDGSFVGSWEWVVYFGAVPSVLAIFAATRSWRKPYVRSLIAGLLLSIALAPSSPLLTAAHALVPGYALLRLPQRILFLSPLFAFALAGVGFDAILSAIGTHRTRGIVATILISLVALEGTLWARRYLRTATPVPVPIHADYLEVLLQSSQPARIAPLTRSLPSYGSAAALGLQLVTGYDPFNVRHYQRYMDLLQYNEVRGSRASVWTDIGKIRRFDMLAALNVLYVVAPQPIDVPADYTLAASFERQPQFRFYEGVKTGPVYVYRNDRFRARAFFVSNVLSAASEEEEERAVQEIDLREAAVAGASAASGMSVADPSDRVEIPRAAAGALDVATQNVNRRFLVISEVWHPGWRAVVDGRAATLYQTDIALLGLWLEPGVHHIELRYWPPGLTAGSIVTVLTIMAIAGLLLIGRRRFGSGAGL
jgi:hypothetical protein